MPSTRPLSERAFAILARRQGTSYWARVSTTALALKSDGCSGPASWTQAYILACYEHDIHYRTGETIFGAVISREQADALFPTRIRQMACDGLGWNPRTWKHLIGFPMAAWRWAGVRVGGYWSYKGKVNDPISDTRRDPAVPGSDSVPAVGPGRAVEPGD